MSRKKISTTIYVTPEQSERLRLLHERTKVPVAVYIREGIDLVLRQYDHLLPGQLPLASPRADGETPVPPSVGGAGGGGVPAPVAAAAAASADSVGASMVERGRMPAAEAKADRAASAGKG